MSWSGLPQRLEDKIIPEPNSGCWLWIGGLTTNGYGKFNKNKKRLAVHCVVYEQTKGYIPNGLEIDHLCRNRSCCNPQHLEAVTSKINSLRGIGVGAQNARKTHCNNGHALTSENIYVNSKKRKCIICNRAGNRMRYQKRRT